jgi:hypothetical protein
MLHGRSAGNLASTEVAMAEGLNNHEVWDAGDLLERLERRDKFFVLDVRNGDEFEGFD